MRRLRSLIATASLCCLPFAAQSDPCATIEQLAHIHDTYRATLSETGTARHHAALSLLTTLVPLSDRKSLKAAYQHDDLPLDMPRLDNLFLQARKDARAVLSGPASPLPAPNADLTWLSGLIEQHRCPAQPNRIAARPAAPQHSAFQRVVTTVTDHATQPAIPLTSAALGLLVFLTVAALRKSRFIRQRQFRRQPRNAVAIAAIATLADGTPHRIKVIDLSQGGMKVAWTAPPASGTTLTVDMAQRSRTASIAWKNEFYAGLLFDDALTAADLQELTTFSTENTRRRPPKAKRRPKERR